MTRTITRDIKCKYCFDLGFETSIVNGIHTYTRCPECVNRERGIPIPWSELSEN